LPGTTNEGQTLGFNPQNRDLVLEEHHPDCSPLVMPHALDEAATASH
jgi:hypothetical protein